MKTETTKRVNIAWEWREHKRCLDELWIFLISLNVFPSTRNQISKALHTVIVIEYSIINQAGTKFLQKNSSDYEVINSVYTVNTEYRVFDRKQGFRIFCIMYCVLQNTILTQYGKYKNWNFSPFAGPYKLAKISVFNLIFLILHQIQIDVPCQSCRLGSFRPWIFACQRSKRRHEANSAIRSNFKS